jgi:hypothetical protein
MLIPADVFSNNSLTRVLPEVNLIDSLLQVLAASSVTDILNNDDKTDQTLKSE